MKLPPVVVDIARAVERKGGTAYLAGGPVRDHHLGRPPKDFDIEVHGVPEDDLAKLLKAFGRVNAVGRSFGVYKLTVDGEELDVSLPRRDSKVGPGHRGIQVAGDPWMDLTEACRRRDLTVNAMLYGILSGETVDPFGGLTDLKARVLRHTDRTTFLEDPLRALRVVQFAARLEFDVHPDLKAMCRDAAIEELPAERLVIELDKLLLKAARPGLGVQLLEDLDIRGRLFPQLDLTGVPEVVDRAAAMEVSSPERDALMYAALLHRCPTPETVLDRLHVHTRAKYPLRRMVLAALAVERPDDSTALRRLADVVPVSLPIRLWWAIDPSWWPDALDEAEHAGVRHGPLPALLGGRELQGLGLSPGPAIGTHLRALREAQTAAQVSTLAEALAFIRDRMNA